MDNEAVPPRRGVVRKFFSTLVQQGPLVAAKRVNEYMQEHCAKIHGVGRLFLWTDGLINAVQRYLDSSFDRKYGVDTSGAIPLKNLKIESDYKNEGIWYEPMSVKIFHQIMRNLEIDFTKFDFIDFGSGKGRVLLLASDYGFKKVIGVEFAQELHRIAGKNAAIYSLYKRKPNNIETICIDAMKFSLPDSPLVVFFFSPFRKMVMEKVLENFSMSLNLNPRKIIFIFYGLNPDTMDAIKSSIFQWKELELRSDWTRETQYKCLLFTNPSS